MNCKILYALIFVGLFSLVSCLTIRRIDSTTPKATTKQTPTPKTTTVSPNNPVKNPAANGPIVVLQHHGTLDGPSGRFRKTELFASPPVDLSLPPVFLPEFIPIHEEPEELYEAATYVVPQFERTQYLTSPPVDLSRVPVFLPVATPISEPSKEGNAAQQALCFVRG